MSRTILVVLGFAAAGAAGALAGRLFAPAAPSSVTAAPEISRANGRIDDLESRFDRFREETLARLSAPVPAPALPATAPAAPLAADAPALGEGAASEAKFEEKVREVVEREAAAQREAWGDRFATMAAQREKGLLDRLTARLDLSSYQREEMEKILARRREAVGGFFRTMFGGGTAPAGTQPPDMAALREQVEKAQAEADEAAKLLLTPEQYQVWQDEDAALRRGPFFGDRGSGGGGGR